MKNYNQKENLNMKIIILTLVVLLNTLYASSSENREIRKIPEARKVDTKSVEVRTARKVEERTVKVRAVRKVENRTVEVRVPRKVEYRTLEARKIRTH